MVEEPERRANARRWLKEQGVRSLSAENGGVSLPQFAQLQTLIGNEAFGLFWSLVAGERANALVMLGNAKLGTPERDCAASVLQGQIAAIDILRELLLDIADPQMQQQDEGAS